MKNSTDTLQFIHDTTGVLVTKYNGTYYYYLKNPQGDVIALADVDGNVVVEYTYDAWGKPLSVTGSMASTLGTLNPIRYRGYYYDTETGLYYLQSRYYDPEMGRFISADALIDNRSAATQNLFLYCWNNPVSCCDYVGLWTAGLSLNANATVFLGASVGIGVFFDDNGNIDLQWSYSVPWVNDTATIGIINAGIGLSGQVTTMDTVYDLHGPSSNAGVGFGAGQGFGLDVISSSKVSDLNGKIEGVQLSYGYSLAMDVHVSNSNTNSVFQPQKISNIIKKLLLKYNGNSSKEMISPKPFQRSIVDFRRFV